VKGWETIWNPAIPRRVAVIPIDDLVEHEEGMDCLCGPAYIYAFNLMTESHHSLDGRENEVR
jgi:hypothetical protein